MGTRRSAIHLALALLLSGYTLCSAGERASSTRVDLEARRYVGLEVGPTLPAGLRDVNSFLMADDSAVGTPLDYQLREVAKGPVAMLWLERVASRDATGLPTKWVVLDVLLPEAKKDEVVVHSVCSKSGDSGPEIIAVFKDEEAEDFTHARRAWRANRLKGKFEEIEVEGVRCVNEGAGI